MPNNEADAFSLKSQNQESFEKKELIRDLHVMKTCIISIRKQCLVLDITLDEAV